MSPTISDRIQAALSKQKDKKQLEHQKYKHLWNELSYSKLIAGNQYSYILSLISLPLGLLFGTLLLDQFFPYPEIRGYQELTAGFMALLFGLFDVGMAATQGNMTEPFMRFISQYRATNPRRAIAYIQFFNFFQMITGLIQVTAVSIYVFTVLIHQTLAHFAWFFLVYSLIQYPGMLQVFESATKAWQRFDKASLVSFMRDTIWAPVFQIVIMSIARVIGEHHPYGMMMILGIGYTFSLYVGDFFALLYGGYIFNQIIKPLGYRFRDLFRTWFIGTGVIKETLSFVGVMWIAGQVLGLLGLITNYWITQWLSAAAAWKGIISMANGLANLGSGWGPTTSSTMSPVSEAYNNKKPELAKYYIQSSIKYIGMIGISFLVMLVILIPRLFTILMDIIPSISNYEQALVIFPIILLTKALDPLNRLGGGLLIALNQRNKAIIMGYIQAPISFVLTYLFLAVWDLGWLSLVLTGFIPSILTSILSLLWIQWKVLKVDYRRPLWQAFGASTLAGICYSGCLYIFTLWWDPFMNLLKPYIGETFAAGILVFIVILLIFFFAEILFYRPFYALFGGWDDETLSHWEKARFMSGPSNFIVRWKYSVDLFFTRRSPLHNRFPICDYPKVFQERDELLKTMPIND